MAETAESDQQSAALAAPKVVSEELNNLIDEISSPDTKTSGLTPEEVEEIAGWLNLPLDPNGEPLEVQIAKFFRSHIIASGHEQIQIDTGPFGMDRIAVNVATADIAIPREADWGINTRGWYLFHYLLPDGTQGIKVMAERWNLTTAKGKVATGATFSLVQKNKKIGFIPQRHSNPVTNSPYIYTSSIPSDFHAKEIYRGLYEHQASKDIQMFHVYNRLPSLANNPPALPG